MPVKCELCEDTGVVCENCGTRWELENGDTCCGAGNPCVCGAEFQWGAVYASTDPDEVKEWVQ